MSGHDALNRELRRLARLTAAGRRADPGPVEEQGQEQPPEAAWGGGDGGESRTREVELPPPSMSDLIRGEVAERRANAARNAEAERRYRTGR